MKNRGFTLVELAIVLVIIGLIVAGILTGQTLIRNAAIRKQISDFDKMQAAVLTFRGKYECLPGDCSHAANFGFTENYYGNGNGIITYESQSGTDVYDHYYGNERCLMFKQLLQAELIPNSMPTLLTTSCDSALLQPGQWAPSLYIPSNNGTYWIDLRPSSTFHHISFSYTTTGGNVYRGFNVLSANDMYAIDSKLDDGNALTGGFVAWHDAVPDAVGIGSGCLDAGNTTSYNLLGTGGFDPDEYHCSASYKLSF